jgi:excisionase family DNA binding protein
MTEHSVLIDALKEVLSGDVISKINKPFMDFQETCVFLGVSASCLYKYRMNNIVPYYKTGKKLYFKKEDLEQYLTQRKVRSNDELATEIDIHTKKRKNYVR